MIVERFVFVLDNHARQIRLPIPVAAPLLNGNYPLVGIPNVLWPGCYPINFVPLIIIRCDGLDRLIYLHDERNRAYDMEGQRERYRP